MKFDQLKISNCRSIIVGISFFIAVFSGAATINVACVGDSITYGYGDTAHSYPIQLQAFLDASEGAGAYHVVNYGINSRTMRNDGNFPYIATGEYTSSLAANPDVVVILLGANDAKTGLNWNVPAKDGDSTSIAIYAADAEALIESYRNLPSSPQIFICTPISTSLAGGSSFGISGTVLDTEIAPEIRTTISAPSDVVLLDLNASFPDDGSYYKSGDSVHPNAAGYGFIAQEVMDAIVGGPASGTPVMIDHSYIDGTNYVVEWVSMAGTAYNLLNSGNLADPWMTNRANIPSTPPTNSIFIPTSSTQDFFKVEVY